MAFNRFAKLELGSFLDVLLARSCELRLDLVLNLEVVGAHEIEEGKAAVDGALNKRCSAFIALCDAAAKILI